jgi:hypothetical protein
VPEAEPVDRIAVQHPAQVIVTVAAVVASYTLSAAVPLAVSTADVTSAVVVPAEPDRVVAASVPASVTAPIVTVLCWPTCFVSNVPEAEPVTTSLPSTLARLIVTVAAIVASYTLSAAVPLAVSDAGVMSAVAVPAELTV